MTYIARPKKAYKEKIVPAMMEKFDYKSIMQVPKLEKIVVSQGLGAATADKKIVDYAVEELTAIIGQKAVGTVFKKVEASFKLRKGMPIGARVTLRADGMYEFLDRLTSSALPRIRDFNGIKADRFDGRGNYSVGLRDNGEFYIFINKK